jgi:hypothetical protein
MTAKEKISV